MMTKMHSFMYLKPSVLPLMSSVSAFNFTMSACVFMKYSVMKMFMLSILNLVICSFYWWNIYQKEVNMEGGSSNPLMACIKISMILFISSEIFFFFSFFWSYFNFSLAPSVEMGFSWPPEGIVFFDPMSLPLANTFILLMSGVSITMSHLELISKNFKKSIVFLLVTITLGFLFTLMQYIEYNNSFFCMNDSVFGTTFFVMTGFHGMHVMLGATYLVKVLLQLLRMETCPDNSTSFDLSSWYWHFVDVIWIFLYFFLYYIGSNYL